MQTLIRKFMRFFFHHFYHSLSWTYDLVAAIVSIGRWQAWGRAVLPHLQGKRVLEIGFGPGHLLVELNRRGFCALGLDESPQMIRQARAHLAESGFSAALLRGYAQSVPFEGDSLDSVISTFPSEYISDKRTLTEVRRVLRPGGRFVIVPMAWMDGKKLLDRLASLVFTITGQTPELTEDFEALIMQKFSEAGFGVEIILEELRGSTVMIVVAEKLKDWEIFESNQE